MLVLTNDQLRTGTILWRTIGFQTSTKTSLCTRFLVLSEEKKCASPFNYKMLFNFTFLIPGSKANYKRFLFHYDDS